MIALRCTRRLLDKLPPGSESAPDSAPNRLGHWYANLLQIQHKPYVLALSERSLLCVLIPAAPYVTLSTRFGAALESLLKALSVPAAYIEKELSHYTAIAITPTVSRSLVSTLNQYMHGLKASVAYEPDLTIRARELWLSEYISEVIGYQAPREVAIELLTAERH